MLTTSFSFIEIKSKMISRTSSNTRDSFDVLGKTKHLNEDDNTQDIQETESIVIGETRKAFLNDTFLDRDIVNGRLVTSEGVPVKVVILVASSARSGSSMIGELLAQQDNQLYLFEPVYYTLKNSAINGTDILRDMIYCQISDEYTKWLRSMSPNKIFRHPMTGRNCGRKNACLTAPALKEACRKANNRIMKVIRIRMRWMKELLDDPYVDLKVIHLVRDPRATIISRRKTFGAKTLNAGYQCHGIEEDLRVTPQLMREYPDKVMGITYEDFCIDPIGKATEMWHFISDNKSSTLPTAWSKYIEGHTQGSPSNKRPFAYSTFRNSKIEYQEWRRQITKKALVEIEKHCKPVLKLLGYNLFGTLKKSRNLDIPLFSKNRIPYTDL
ncbi:hypothetical protein SK128_006125 [Halocaridina rubra]|uniref:Sulfotransferase domain-containing protein n=1 Tax=Halocaridina rubra TaxID=373956 RepID=A0AAN9A4B4_HALRR